MTEARFRTIYDRKKVPFHHELESRTKQADKDACDINTIMERYRLTGIIDHVETRQAQFGDFSNVKDYQSAYQALLDAEEQFMALPASIRKYFDNDPAKLLQFVEDPENNYEEGVKIGLFKAKAPEFSGDSGLPNGNTNPNSDSGVSA